MKKFTFLAAAVMAFMSVTANAGNLVDKKFFKIANDKATVVNGTSGGWTAQDISTTTLTPSSESLTVKNTKNGGRMLNYFWNESAWTKSDGTARTWTVDGNSSNVPEKYKFSMNLKMTTMAARSDMEFVLLPVNACTYSDARVATHNAHWWNSTDEEDYFFRWRVTTAPTAANGDYSILINEIPSDKTFTSTGLSDDDAAAQTITMSCNVNYNYSVVIDTKANRATYTISHEGTEGTVIDKTGYHDYKCTEDRAGIFVFSMNGSSTHEFSDINLSYETEGPLANEPTVDLLAARGELRDYYVTFSEGEILHWKQLGNVDEPTTGETRTAGDEYTVAYGDANDTRSFDTNSEEVFGSKIITCAASGNLITWTTLADYEEKVSDEVTTAVDCSMVTMPTPVATISNVEEGYAKTYTITADNSNTLLNPTVTICYEMSNGKSGTLNSGESIKFDGEGSVTLYSKDGTHEPAWYGESAPITVENKIKYVVAETKDYAVSFDDAAKLGLTETLRLVDLKNGAAQSHWERIYSEEKRGIKADGTNEAYVEGTEYSWVKSGFGVIASADFTSGSCGWNVYYADDANYQTAFAPLVPQNGTATKYAIFPLEGIVYDATDVTNLTINLDEKYKSDDANTPNFFIVHTRGGYDRPDKGDCNVTTVVNANESYSLYRFDTAICDVRVMTAAGFSPKSDAVENIVAPVENVNAPVYTISGVKVSTTEAGKIYIQNGKKFLAK